MRRAGVSLGLIAVTLGVSACAGISFTKAGETEAKGACKAIAGIQGEDVTISQGMEGIFRAEDLAVKAAAANDDYARLESAVQAFSESMISGSENLAQSAWSNLAQICNDL